MSDNMEEKRMAGDYEVIQAVHIGDREVVLGENPQDETGMKYMCAFCQQNALFAESCRLESRNNMIISIKRDDCAVLIGAKEALCL